MKLSYLAGIIDGEGSISLLKSGAKNSRKPILSVGMTDAIVPESIEKEFGGWIKVKKFDNRQDMHIWSLKGNKVIELLHDILPYLVIERRRNISMLLCVNWVSQRPGARVKQERELLFQEMKELNSIRRLKLTKIEYTTPNDDDFAYLAGIIDGEGYVSQKGEVEIHSTDPELCSWCKCRFHGNIYTYAPRLNKHNKIWRWQHAPTNNKWATDVSNYVLIPRKQQALKAAIDFKSKPKNRLWEEKHPEDAKKIIEMVQKGNYPGPVVEYLYENGEISSRPTAVTANKLIKRANVPDSAWKGRRKVKCHENC